MTSTLMSRRQLAFRVAAIPVGLTMAARVLSASNTMESGVPAHGDGLSHAAEAIHQEVVFGAGRARVYAALTSTEQFDAVTRLSDGAELMKAPGAKPTSISRDAGGSFTLFGGYITGRNLELLQDERLVQAWRAASWKPGDFSIAQFTLIADGPGTKLIFEHRGFPEGQGTHLADGWHSHYWTPLAKFLSQG
jgi:activator of HSP90 ATPase